MSPERLHQIEELYHAARRVSPEEREAILAKLDPELRREVESLLAEQSYEGMLDRPMAEAAAELVPIAAGTGLSAGFSLGPYRIEAKLGEGGMGAVFRALDSKLNRPVAIKILSGDLADAAARRRFQREAQMVSSLNHPHILTVYDAGEFEGRQYLVTEYMDGGTLGDWAHRAKRTWRELVELLVGVADGLATAHEANILHRDIKPANVLLTKSGYAKLADFGLAKLAEDVEDGSATRTSMEKWTKPGVVIGTTAYMSPEQASGQKLDTRSDIFSFGVVLYELLSGRRPFAGANDLETLHTIIHGAPQPLPDDVPPEIRMVVEKAMERDPADRYQAMRELAVDLRRLARRPVQAPSGEVAAARSGSADSAGPPARRWWFVAAVGLLLGFLGGMTGWRWLRAPPNEPHPVARWTTMLPAPEPVTGLGLSVSRDGTRLAYGGQRGGVSRIWVRLLDQGEEKPVAGTEGGVRPFFSPDGQWLAYFTGSVGALKKVPVTGGTPTTLCEEASFYRGSWGEDDRLVFSGISGGLMRVSAAGGHCETLTTTDQKDGELHDWPQILPGGRAVLFTLGRFGSMDSARIAVLDLKTGHYRVVVNGGSSGCYVPSGHLVYVRRGVMFAVPFDLKRLEVTGPETPVIEGVYYNSSAGFADYSFSASGLLVYMAETGSINLGTLQWLDRKGTSLGSPAPSQNYLSMRLSPDGQRAAVAVRSAGYDIWVIDLARGGLTRLTTEGIYWNPVWTRDSKRVAFNDAPDGSYGLFWAPADGSGKREALLAGRAGIPNSWTNDGKTLLYESRAPARIWTLQPTQSGGDGKPRLLFEATSFNQGDAQLSPGGQWIAYNSDESGKNRVYVRPFPGPGGKTPISIEGGQEPRWSRDGRELFYRDPEKNRLMAVEIQTSPAFRVGHTSELFALGNVPWDVAPDGKRFLVVKEPETNRGVKLQVVVNWFEELRQKAPTGKK